MNPALQPDGIPFALADNGVTLRPALLPMFHGNIGIIGRLGSAHGQGQSCAADQGFQDALLEHGCPLCI